MNEFKLNFESSQVVFALVLTLVGWKEYRDGQYQRSLTLA